jgi:hypothetical protein
VTGFPVTALMGSPSQFPGVDFALHPQTRRYARPNRVRHPTDCMFASGCFPPRLTTTQFPSATGNEHEWAKRVPEKHKDAGDQSP